MRASAFSPRLDVRERIPSGPTGALSVLFEAEGASVSGAHVAYPSGDAVVVAETHVGFPSTFSRVALAEGEDEGSSPREREPPSCVAWAPGETRGALLVARGRVIHLCAPAERDDDDETDETSAPSRSSPRSRRRAWESVGRARCAAKVVAAAWTSDGTAFVSAAADGELRAWRVEETDAPDEEAETRDRASYGRSFLGVRTAWRVVAETSGKPHTTLAAGASVSAPVASAARGSRFARVWDARGYRRADPAAPHGGDVGALEAGNAGNARRFSFARDRLDFFYEYCRARDHLRGWRGARVDRVRTRRERARRDRCACAPRANRGRADGPGAVRVRPGARRRALARVAPRAAQRAA